MCPILFTLPDNSPSVESKSSPYKLPIYSNSHQKWLEMVKRVTVIENSVILQPVVLPLTTYTIIAPFQQVTTSLFRLVLLINSGRRVHQLFYRQCSTKTQNLHISYFFYK